MASAEAARDAAAEMLLLSLPSMPQPSAQVTSAYLATPSAGVIVKGLPVVYEPSILQTVLPALPDARVSMIEQFAAGPVRSTARPFASDLVSPANDVCLRSHSNGSVQTKRFESDY